MKPQTLFQDNLMPLAGSIVVILYAVGVVVRRSTQWYEWLAAAAGLGFGMWFWFTEYRRYQRRAGKR